MTFGGFDSARFGDLFWTFLSRGETPPLPHPRGRRWALCKMHNGWGVYLGRFHALYSSPAHLRALAAARLARQAAA